MDQEEEEEEEVIDLVEEEVDLDEEGLINLVEEEEQEEVSIHGIDQEGMPTLLLDTVPHKEGEHVDCCIPNM